MRDPLIQAFLAAAEVELGRCRGPAADLAAEVARRWRNPSPAAPAPERLAVCDWIAPALGDGPLARAFAPLVPLLAWRRRASATPDQPFYDRHANAMILGPGALEPRDDVWIGATVMAPGTVYPDHDHAPAEVYLPLTAGEWWNAAMDWTDPGLDGFVYNPPGITHAMRAGSGPFLALWFLPL